MHVATRTALIALLLLISAQALAQRPGADLCRNAIATVERADYVPDRLMQAISIMESGRRDPASGVAAWPWTINVEGVGAMFDTKEEAIAAVRANQAQGKRSIDVGCMQVNLIHHGSAFSSLEEAFDPVSNVRYAARFLKQLLDKTGSWPNAVAGYHSLTPDIGGEYAKKVLAIWARPNLGAQVTQQAAVTPQLRAPAASAIPAPRPTPVMAPVTAMPGGLPARLLPMPGAGGSSVMGRGLASYRALPTQLVGIQAIRRF